MTTNNWSVAVDVHGPVGSGKTVVLASLIEALRELPSAPRYGMSARVEHQLLVMGAGGAPDRTGDVRVDTRMGLEAEEQDVVEYVSLTYDESEVPDVHLIAHAGEALASEGGAFNPARRIKMYRDDQRRLLIAVVNPFNWDRDIAKRAIYSFVVCLMDTAQLDLYTAIITAVRHLFGTHESQVSGAVPTPPTPDNPTGSVLGPRQVYAPRLRQLCNDVGAVRIHFNPDASPEHMFTAELADTGDQNIARLQKIYAEITKIASQETHMKRSQNDALKQIVRGVDKGVVCFTHMDLAPWTPAVTEKDYHRIQTEMEAFSGVGLEKELLRMPTVETLFNEFCEPYTWDHAECVAIEPMTTQVDASLGRELYRNIQGFYRMVDRLGLLAAKPDQAQVAAPEAYDQMPDDDEWDEQATQIVSKDMIADHWARAGGAVAPTPRAQEFAPAPLPAPTSNPGFIADPNAGGPPGPKEKDNLDSSQILAEGVFTGLRWFAPVALVVGFGVSAYVGVALASDTLSIDARLRVLLILGLVLALVMPLWFAVIHVFLLHKRRRARWEFTSPEHEVVLIRGLGPDPVRVPWDRLHIETSPFARMMNIGWIGEDRVAKVQVNALSDLEHYLERPETPAVVRTTGDLIVFGALLVWILGLALTFMELLQAG